MKTASLLVFAALLISKPAHSKEIDWKPAALAVKCASGTWNMPEVLDAGTGEVVLANEIETDPVGFVERLIEWIPSMKSGIENANRSVVVASDSYELGAVTPGTTSTLIPPGCEARYLAKYLDDGKRLFLDRELLRSLPESQKGLAILRAKFAVTSTKKLFSEDYYDHFFRAWFQRRITPAFGFRWTYVLSDFGAFPMWAGLPIQTSSESAKFHGLWYERPTFFFDSRFISARFVNPECGRLRPEGATFAEISRQCSITFDVDDLSAPEWKSPLFGILNIKNFRTPVRIAWSPQSGIQLSQTIYKSNPTVTARLDTDWFGSAVVDFTLLKMDLTGKVQWGSFKTREKRTVIEGFGDKIVVDSDAPLTVYASYNPKTGKPEVFIGQTWEGSSFRVSYRGQTHEIRKYFRAVWEGEDVKVELAESVPH